MTARLRRDVNADGAKGAASPLPTNASSQNSIVQTLMADFIAMDQAASARSVIVMQKLLFSWCCLSKPKNSPHTFLLRIIGFETFTQLYHRLFLFSFFSPWCTRFGRIHIGHGAAQSPVRAVLKALEYSGHGVPWFAAAAALIYFGRRGPWTTVGLNLFVGLLADLAAVATVKAIVRRQRPSYNRSTLDSWIFCFFYA